MVEWGCVFIISVSTWEMCLGDVLEWGSGRHLAVVLDSGVNGGRRVQLPHHVPHHHRGPRNIRESVKMRFFSSGTAGGEDVQGGW